MWHRTELDFNVLFIHLRSRKMPFNVLVFTLRSKVFTITSRITAARLAQLGERRSAVREAVGSNPGRTNTQGP